VHAVPQVSAPSPPIFPANSPESSGGHCPSPCTVKKASTAHRCNDARVLVVFRPGAGKNRQGSQVQGRSLAREIKCAAPRIPGNCERRTHRFTIVPTTPQEMNRTNPTLRWLATSEITTVCLDNFWSCPRRGRAFFAFKGGNSTNDKLASPRDRAATCIDNNHYVPPSSTASLIHT
jgi:hypothetical protein